MGRTKGVEGQKGSGLFSAFIHGDIPQIHSDPDSRGRAERKLAFAAGLNPVFASAGRF